MLLGAEEENMFSDIHCKVKITTLLFFIVFSIWPGSVSAFIMPAGIPQAWIEPDTPAPTVPSPWTENVSGHYYVDNTVT